jgi:hypothetical protein
VRSAPSGRSSVPRSAACRLGIVYGGIVGDVSRPLSRHDRKILQFGKKLRKSDGSMCMHPVTISIMLAFLLNPQWLAEILSSDVIKPL